MATLLAKILQMQGTTQTALAKRVNIAQPRISVLASGKEPVGCKPERERLEHYFQTPIDILLGEVDENDN